MAAISGRRPSGRPSRGAATATWNSRPEGSKLATGQSLPSTTRPPASRMRFQPPPRAARSGPRLAAHTLTGGVGGAAGAVAGRVAWPRPRCPIDAARVHRRHDVQRLEACLVGRVERLDVIDAMTAPALGRRVGRRGGLDRVEGHAHRAVADGVHHHLPAAAIEQRDHAIAVPRRCSWTDRRWAGWRTARAAWRCGSRSRRRRTA